MDDHAAGNAITVSIPRRAGPLCPTPLAPSAGAAGSSPARPPVALPEVPPGCLARLSVNGVKGLLGQRLTDLGFTSGATVRVVMKGPGQNLIAVSIRDTVIALRADEARPLLVTI